MRTVRQPGGMGVMVECRADQFGETMKTMPKSARCVLTDGRPALITKDEFGGVMYITIHAYAWSILKKIPKHRHVPSRVRLCEFCRSEMKLAREYETSWTFTCPVCKSVEVHDKRFIGGTRGAGEKEKR